MSQVLWPTELIPSRTDIAVIDSVGRFTSPLNGVTQTVGRPGSRLRMSLALNTLNGRERIRLQRLITETRGGTKPIRVPDHTYTRAGSVSGAELVSAPTFSSAAEYSTSSAYSIALSERVLRATSITASGTSGILRLTNAVSVTSYRPYVGRVLVTAGRGTYSDLELRFGSSAFDATYGSLSDQVPGMLNLAFVPYASTTHFGLTQTSVTAIAGDFLEISYFSVAPCGLVDNAPNALLHSNDYSQAAWTKARSSITVNASAGPNGVTDMDSLNETTANDTHYVSQAVTKAAVAEDWTGRVYCKASNRTQARLHIGELGTNIAIVLVNLSDGSIISGPTASGSVTNARASVVNMGGGIYEITITARIPSSITTTNQLAVLPAEGGSVTYAGTGTQSAIYVGGASYAVSGVPIHYRETAATADSDGTTQNLGGGLYTKGWPASTSGLLLPGDQVEINGQLLILNGPVDSDAAGRAFLPFASIRVPPADNEPVIMFNPLAKMIPQESENGWSNVPGLFSDSELVLVETG